MGKSSKKHKRKLERKDKRKGFEDKIREAKLTNIANSLIPADAAIGTFGDLYEKQIQEECFRLVFSAYHHKQCGLIELSESNQAKSLIKLFDRITNTNQNTIGASGIVRDKINKDGLYKQLFEKVPKDTELKEAAFAGTGRIFFYTFRSMFCIVAIRFLHL